MLKCKKTLINKLMKKCSASPSCYNNKIYTGPKCLHNLKCSKRKKTNLNYNSSELKMTSISRLLLNYKR